MAIPALRLNPRLKEGFGQRTLSERPEEAELWIQAASAGEAYLACKLLKVSRFGRRMRVIVTVGTRQGKEILSRVAAEFASEDEAVPVRIAYFPFDQPALMEQAVATIKPKVAVLLESEMWPGLLAALKKHGSKILIVNGRMSQRSLKRYCTWPSFWRAFKPDRILAVSDEDAERFARLFGRENVSTMPNMKFDRIGEGERGPCAPDPVSRILPYNAPFVVLGSVRREEEPLVAKIVMSILNKQPETIIGVFPKHLYRLGHWRRTLQRMPVRWVLRSSLEAKVPKGTVILWDIFGELATAYGHSNATFVGGSLVPLGGQNFLEAVLCGVVPVIGPWWDDFAWIGREILDQGLVRQAANWMEVTALLLEDLRDPKPYETVRADGLKYVNDHQGGTSQAWRVIEHFLNKPSRETL
jgi:3-deoxy-D-manno-octulosonic-acid transferase